MRRVDRIEETDEAVGLEVEGETFSDRVLLAFQPNREQTLRGGGEGFIFQDHAPVRLAGGQVTMRGKGGSTAISFPMRAQQEVVLRFATPEELKDLLET